MRIDLYTKSVLTVIAAALCCLCIEQVFSPRTTVAAQGVQLVRLVDPKGNNIVQFSGSSAYVPVMNVR